MRTILYLFTLLVFISKPVLADTQQLLQLIDYVGVDYSSAVQDGQIVNNTEYEEMMDFAAGISLQLEDLPKHKIKLELVGQSQILSQWIQQKKSADNVSRLTTQMHRNIINAYKIMVVPRKQPDLTRLNNFFRNNVHHAMV